MRFLPIEFSKSIVRLLIGVFFLGNGLYGESVNLLKDKDLKDTVKAVRPRLEIPLEDRWDVASLYKTMADWRRELKEVISKEKGPFFSELQKFQGRLKNPEAVKGLLDLSLGIERKLTKLYTYAHLRLDEDLGEDETKQSFGMITAYLHDYQLESSWIEPELLSLTEKEFQNLLDSPILRGYRFYLEKMGRSRPHRLDRELEELLALSGKALDTSYRAFGALNNADLKFRDAIDEKGQTRPLSTASYLSYLRSSDRTLRKTAFEHLHQGYEEHANTLCELLQGQVQKHVYLAKARKFKSCLEAALFPHQVDPAVYTNLIASVRKSLPLMHDYIRLRKEILGLHDLKPYDLYVPLVEEASFDFDYNEGRKLVIDSVAPLGKEYQSLLANGLKEARWVDVYENLRKRSGAYSSGCYDSAPFILMNYSGNLNDVLTLAHEAGHSMHSLLSRKNQPYVYAEYPIFVAEVASTFNEQLLLKHLKGLKKSKKELSFLINYEIEGIRGTIFRQTLFAEFEKQVHEWVESGIPLTPALLKKFYKELNVSYYGPDLVLTPEMEIEWARIPHFYYNFYVYQYATGLSAALSLFDQAIGSEEKTAKYLEFISSGGSLYPLDLLERAGVDMRKGHAVEQALAHFKKLVEELKNLY